MPPLAQDRILMKNQTTPDQEFLFATGIENSYPTIRWEGKAVRRDGMELSAHYDHWREDFDLVRGLPTAN